MIQLVLVRHGESVWNKENRFTGWTDVDLSDWGIQQAKLAGRRLASEGLTNERCPGSDPRYASLDAEAIPLTEALEDTSLRVLPYWKESIEPLIRKGKRVILVAHGNTIRVLVKHLEGLSDEEIMDVDIPTASPLVYELDEDLHTLRKYDIRI